MSRTSARGNVRNAEQADERSYCNDKRYQYGDKRFLRGTNGALNTPRGVCGREDAWKSGQDTRHERSQLPVRSPALALHSLPPSGQRHCAARVAKGRTAMPSGPCHLRSSTCTRRCALSDPGWVARDQIPYGSTVARPSMTESKGCGSCVTYSTRASRSLPNTSLSVASLKTRKLSPPSARKLFAVTV